MKRVAGELEVHPDIAGFREADYDVNVYWWGTHYGLDADPSGQAGE